MHFGFSYVGLIFLLMLFVPNSFWPKYPPQDYDKYVARESKVLLLFERIGQVTVTTAAVIFTDFNLKPWSLWYLWLIVAFLLMILYEIHWNRYFRSERTMLDFYRSILGIPLAGATLPVIAFFLLSIYGRNWVLGVAVVFLGIGHIGIHSIHKKEVEQELRDSK